jgi:type IV pilus assembly protein PilP
VEENKGQSRSQRDVILPEYSLDELKLIGIVSRIQPAKAMLLDPTGKGHVIQRGQFVGKADVVQTSGASGSAYEVNWRVDRIREDNVVLVRGDPSNPDVPTKKSVIPLRPDSTPAQ